MTWPVFGSLQGAGRQWVLRDLGAGLTLAAIAVPEQIATAGLAGLPPQAGLVAFAAATLGFVVFGGSRVLSAGADSTIAPIFAGGLAAVAVAGTAHYAALAAALALMVGLILTLAGVLRLGWVANLLSRPVITGFLAGISLRIVVSQAPSALGLPHAAGGVVPQALDLAVRLGEVNWIAAAIAGTVLAAMLVAEKLSPRIPAALAAIVAATAVTALFHLDRRGVELLGALPGGLPSLGFPSLGYQSLTPLVGLAFIVALVVMVQTATTVRAFTEEGGAPDLDRDFVGLGAGGLLAGLAGAFPVNASPPRTAAVAAAGGRSQVGGLAAALVVLALMAFGGQLLAGVPEAALAGVLLFIALRIFHFGDFARLARRTPAEFGLAVGTAALIVALPIQTGVALGMFSSLVHGVYTITRTRLIAFERAPGTTVWWPEGEEMRGETEPGVLVAGFQAPLSFLNAEQFRHDVLAAVESPQSRPRLFVLEASSIVGVDFTAAGVLIDIIGRLRSAGVTFAIARLESVRAHAAFERFGVMEALGDGHLFRSVAEAIEALAGSGASPSPQPSATAPARRSPLAPG